MLEHRWWQILDLSLSFTWQLTPCFYMVSPHKNPMIPFHRGVGSGSETYNGSPRNVELVGRCEISVSHPLSH